MKCPFRVPDLLYFLVLFYVKYQLISGWQVYGSCYAPIQCFLLFTFSFFIIFRIFLVLMGAPDLSNKMRKGLLIFFHWALNPFCIYMTAQGIIWQAQNHLNTPGCVPDSRKPVMIWIWLAVISIITLIMTIMTLFQIRNWCKVYMSRRRIRQFMNMMDRGEYEALSQMLINDGNLNNKVGLLPSDIAKITTLIYTQSFMDLLRLDHLESCPICFEDFRGGDQVTSLPKCGHIFHPNCINNWLVKSPLCPMCRGNVRSNLYNSDSTPLDNLNINVENVDLEAPTAQ